jgi:hypothetical protein
MSTLPAHSPPLLPAAPASTDYPVPVLRCKRCKVPLPDATWKNCASCRKSRTEAYNRWKQSASLRSTEMMNLSESLLRLRQHSSSLFRTVDSSTSSQAPGPTAPLDHHSNEPSHSGDSSATSQLANDQPRRTSASTAPPRVEAIEYQWSEELVADLLALPPRSRYVGKFSIVADPAVNNSTRAHLFARQLHARAVPISCDVPSRPLSFHIPLTTLTLSLGLAQGLFAANFLERGQQQFLLFCVILHLPRRVSGSVRRLCR